MGYTLTVPVSRSELQHALLSHMGLADMSESERQEAARRCQDAASLVVALAPDLLRAVQVRVR